MRIDFEGRAAFIAECKIWRGAAELAKAIDQLVSYLTWRDCKAALVVFNKQNAGFAEILDKIPEALREHRLHRALRGSHPAGEWRNAFASAQHPSGEVLVHTFSFNLYCG
jgi:hypothetical protein